MRARAFASCRKLGDPEGSIEENTFVHQSLLDELNTVARDDGWPGTTVTEYVIILDHVSITVVPGPAFATVPDLREAYKRYCMRPRPENDNSEQGRLV